MISPLVINRPSPEAICWVASVAMNEGRPILVAPQPLSSPSPVAASAPSRIATPPGSPNAPNSDAATTPVIVATAAMLRSISPHSSTNVMPVETTARVETWARILRRLITLRKLSVVRLKNTIKITSVINGARSRARRRAQLIALLPRMLAWLAEAVWLIFYLSFNDRDGEVWRGRWPSTPPHWWEYKGGDAAFVPPP